jgi:hypothetical protein
MYKNGILFVSSKVLDTAYLHAPLLHHGLPDEVALEYDVLRLEDNGNEFEEAVLT